MKGTAVHFTDEQLEMLKIKMKLKAAELDISQYPLPPLGIDQAKLWPLGNKARGYSTDFCAMVVAHMSQGYSLESFAATISTSVSNVKKWREQFPEFDYACECGKAAQLFVHEKLGMTITRTGKGSGEVWKFLMKNQHKWADKVEVTGADGGPIKTETSQTWDANAESELTALLKKAGKLIVDDETQKSLDQL